MASLGEIKVCFIIYGYFHFPIIIEMLTNQQSPKVCLIKNPHKKTKKANPTLALGL